MRHSELKAVDIIQMALGDKRTFTKTEAELAFLLKKRLTKKECSVLNDLANGVDQEVTMAELRIDEERYDEIVSGALKKLKNQSVHGDFFE
ncbi:MAG: hypothetical protein IBX45_03550 [Campylobacterales bacterium]|nr:hypothetical protein [Campylobacterales bacterium]